MWKMVKPCEHGKWSKFPANDGFWNAMEFPYFSHSSYYVITCPAKGINERQAPADLFSYFQECKTRYNVLFKKML